MERCALAPSRSLHGNGTLFKYEGLSKITVASSIQISIKILYRMEQQCFRHYVTE